MKIVPDNPNGLIRPPEPDIAGHLALNFINTLFAHRGSAIDLFQRDDDVEAWLSRMDLPVSGADQLSSGRLLKSARLLRNTLNKAVSDKKAGVHLSLEVLNTFLTKTWSHIQVERNEVGKPHVRRVWPSESPEQFLAPIAEAAAHLLTEQDFQLVRQCKNPDCILWFLDTTKAHRRSWCNMATCGNQTKVMNHRLRHHHQLDRPS